MTVVQADIKGDLEDMIDTMNATAEGSVKSVYADALATIIYDAILSQTVTLTTLSATGNLGAPVTLITGDSTVS